ncbi:MAG: imidazole glycerol phosphate synthase subunit HisH [Methanobacteriota archaeon]|nr:MAG: imidazole glycerol phosphate synthase subunit HisH [Euryarchaeota archaeon]
MTEINEETRIVGILDYGGGNIGSVSNALKFLGYKSLLVRSEEELEATSKVIFPGVGNFGSAMRVLEEQGLLSSLRKEIIGGKPFLGICLGYQALFERSEESPGVEGLGIFKGNVVKFRKGKIPQIGWNEVSVPSSGSLLEAGYYYFVNSYYPVPNDERIKVGYTDYEDTRFCSAIQYDNIWGVQFHPEKSGELGLRFLRRWLQC